MDREEFRKQLSEVTTGYPEIWQKIEKVTKVITPEEYKNLQRSCYILPDGRIAIVDYLSGNYHADICRKVFAKLSKEEKEKISKLTAIVEKRFNAKLLDNCSNVEENMLNNLQFYCSGLIEKYFCNTQGLIAISTQLGTIDLPIYQFFGKKITPTQADTLKMVVEKLEFHEELAEADTEANLIRSLFTSLNERLYQPVTENLV